MFKVCKNLFVGFGNPTASAGYQGWGAPAGPQVPAPWSSTYGAPTQQTGYGSYGTYPFSCVDYFLNPVIVCAKMNEQYKIREIYQFTM